MLLLYRRLKRTRCSFGFSNKTSTKQRDLSLLATREQDTAACRRRPDEPAPMHMPLACC